MKTQDDLMLFFTATANTILVGADADIKPLWGRMNLQQMIEHLTLAIKMSNGKLTVPIVTPPDKIDKLKTVGLLSNRPLPKGFQNVALPVEPIPLVCVNKEEAVKRLYAEFNDFLALYNNPNASASHNLFGQLNLHEWLWFHYKHFMHHFAQFGLVEPFDKLD